jgi:hypothetical protein
MEYKLGKNDPREDNINAVNKNNEINLINGLTFIFLSKKKIITEKRIPPNITPNAPKSYNSVILDDPNEAPAK